MSDSGTGEKTEEPTPERLRKLRREGNVPKSQDITTAISFLVCFCVLAGSFGYVGSKMTELFRLAVAEAFAKEVPTIIIHRFLLASLQAFAMIVAPVIATAFVMGLGLNLAQVGFLFTLKPVTPDLKKINPVQGLKNLFNMKKVVELVKTVIKFTVVSVLSYLALKDALRDVVLIIRGDLHVGIKIIGAIIWDFCTKIGAAFIIIAAFDAFYQRKRYTKDNMMSKYDVKQEYKQQEGDPHYKAERRRFHQEILNSASPQAVKGADVVVRNPEHIAVALKYEKEGGGAPTVVAKGTRIHANKILEAAKRYGVPVVRNVPLAQALDKLDVNEEIPEELYEAVAEVLNFIYALVEEQKQKGRKA